MMTPSSGCLVALSLTTPVKAPVPCWALAVEAAIHRAASAVADAQVGHQVGDDVGDDVRLDRRTDSAFRSVG